MADVIDRSDLRSLSAEDRLRLIEELWDSLSPDEHPALSDAQRAEIDRRMDALDAGLSVGAPWSEVRKRIVNGR